MSVSSCSSTSAISKQSYCLYHKYRCTDTNHSTCPKFVTLVNTYYYVCDKSQDEMSTLCDIFIGAEHINISGIHVNKDCFISLWYSLLHALTSKHNMLPIKEAIDQSIASIRNTTVEWFTFNIHPYTGAVAPAANLFSLEEACYYHPKKKDLNPDTCWAMLQLYDWKLNWKKEVFHILS